MAYTMVIPTSWCSKMSPTDSWVYWLLCYKAKDNIFCKGYNYILECLNKGISKSTLKRTLKRLEEKGFIKRINNHTEKLKAQILFQNFNKREVKEMTKTFIGLKKSGVKMNPNYGQNEPKSWGQNEPHSKTYNKKELFKDNSSLLNKEKNLTVKSETSSEYALQEKQKDFLPKENKITDCEKINRMSEDVRAKHKEKRINNITSLYSYFYIKLKEKNIRVHDKPLASELGSLKYVLKILKQEDIDPKIFLDYVIDNWSSIRNRHTYESGISIFNEVIDFPNVFYKNSFTRLLKDYLDNKDKKRIRFTTITREGVFNI